MMFMLMVLLMMQLKRVPTFLFVQFRHSNALIKSVVLWTNGWIIRRVQCRGRACRLHAECFEKVSAGTIRAHFRIVVSHIMRRVRHSGFSLLRRVAILATLGSLVHRQKCGAFHMASAIFAVC